MARARNALGQFTRRRTTQRPGRPGVGAVAGTEVGGVVTGETVILGAQPGEAAAAEEAPKATRSTRSSN